MDFDFKKLASMKFKISIGCGIAAFFAFILGIVFLVGMFMSPIQNFHNSLAELGNNASMFFEKLGNFFTFKGYNANSEVFYNYIEEEYEFYLKKHGVVLDTTLIASTVFHGQVITEDGLLSCNQNYDSECEANGTKEIDYVKYRKEVEDIIEGMLIEITYHTCKPIEDYDEAGEPIYGYTVTCGTSAADCNVNKCTENYEKDSYKAYIPKSKEEFSVWLMENYIDEKLLAVNPYYKDYNNIAKENAKKQAIEDIYSQKSGYESLMGANISTDILFSSLVYNVGSFKGNIRYFTQTDYRYGGNTIPFTSTTIRKSGCGLAATSTIVSTFTERDISPVNVGVDYCTSSLCTNDGTYGFSIMRNAASDYGLNVSSNYDCSTESNRQRILDDLASGNSLIMVRVGPGSISSGIHFIVLTGVTEDKKITIADPADSSNTNRTWELKTICSEAKASGFMTISR